MTSKADIDDFAAQPALALVGVSRSGNKFSNGACKELREKGYRVYAVNDAGGTFAGEPIYTSLEGLPEKVENVLVMVKPERSAAVMRAAAAAGARRVWLQQGAESDEALRAGQELGLRVVSGECILMYAGKSGFHRFHGFFRRLFGKKLT